MIDADSGLDVGEGAAREEKAPHAKVGGNAREQRERVEWALEEAHAVGRLVGAPLLRAGTIECVNVAATLDAWFALAAGKVSPEVISTFRHRTE